jgi:hypothetical protein
VRTVVDARLREEARRYALRYACEDCIHFCGGGAAQTARQFCSLAYPAAPRRGALDGPRFRPGSGEAGDVPSFVEFCKTFEVA